MARALTDAELDARLEGELTRLSEELGAPVDQVASRFIEVARRHLAAHTERPTSQSQWDRAEVILDNEVLPKWGSLLDRLGKA